MDCRTYQDLVAAHVDGVLELQERIDADAHVSACSACAELRAADQRIRSVVRDHAPSHGLPPDVRARIVQALDAAAQHDSTAAVPIAARWRVRLVVAGAIAATLLLVIGNPFRPSSPDLLAVLVDDVRNANAGAGLGDVRTDSVDQLRDYYSSTGKFAFDHTVEDFSGMGLRPVSGALSDIGDVPTTLTVYEGPASKVVCRRFLSGAIRLPSGGERVGEATVFTVGDVTVRVQRMGNVICVLASAMPRDEFVRTLLQPMPNH